MVDSMPQFSLSVQIATKGRSMRSFTACQYFQYLAASMKAPLRVRGKGVG
jgi:hypothetical protein